MCCQMQTTFRQKKKNTKTVAAAATVVLKIEHILLSVGRLPYEVIKSAGE